MKRGKRPPAGVVGRKRGEPKEMQIIRRRLPLAPVPGLSGIRLHLAHSRTGLGRLLTECGGSAAPPYWAYCWAGGLALASHFEVCPETVAGRSVLDLGAGGGVVAIAAAKAGAREVMAAEIDPCGRAAIAANAAANGVRIAIVPEDLLAGPPPDIDIVCAGDLFYAPEIAEAAMKFLDRCAQSAISVLIGDPGRRYLPPSRLVRLADYPVADFGEQQGSGGRSGVFALRSR